MLCISLVRHESGSESLLRPGQAKMKKKKTLFFKEEILPVGSMILINERTMSDKTCYQFVIWFGSIL